MVCWIGPQLCFWLKVDLSKIFPFWSTFYFRNGSWKFNFKTGSCSACKKETIAHIFVSLYFSRMLRAKILEAKHVKTPIQGHLHLISLRFLRVSAVWEISSYFWDAQKGNSSGGLWLPSFNTPTQLRCLVPKISHTEPPIGTLPLRVQFGVEWLADSVLKDTFLCSQSVSGLSRDRGSQPIFVRINTGPYVFPKVRSQNAIGLEASNYWLNLKWPTC